MNTKFYYALMGLLLLGGCSMSEDQTNDYQPLDEPAGPIGDPAQEVAGDNGAQPYVSGPVIPQECVGAPVVGILNDIEEGSCDIRELPQDWVWRPMFETGSPQVSGLGLPVPAELGRYCMYEYVGAQPLEEAGQYWPILQAIDAHPFIDLDSVAADCMGFVGMGDLNDPNIGDALQESFRLNIDAVDASDLAATEAYRRPVDVAVIDSVSQEAVDQQIDPANEHGLYMSKLIGDIACPKGVGKCPAQIHHVLAMPREDFQYPDWTVGKLYGSKVDVAIGLYYAVQRWREAKLNSDPDMSDRLVVNMSIGYDRLNPGTEELTRGPTASLHAALQFAACHGVMVFAASGNIRDENCPDNETGPLAPASFEDFRAPTEAECQALGFVSDWDGEFPAYTDPVNPRPLVYAVGGVDAYDAYLVNGRKLGRPQLAATGANGNSKLTGSSVSAAVATATASLLWSYDPYLRPEEVYDAIYGSGWALGVGADFGSGGEIHRLSVCAALDQVCGPLPGNMCPQLGCVAGPPAIDGNLGGFFAEVESLVMDPGTVVEESQGQPSAPVCENPSLAEVVTPQPELPICGHCSADIADSSAPNDDRVYMTIDSFYQGQIEDAVLIVEDAAGMGTAITFDPAVITALNNPAIDVVKVYFDAPETVAATLSFTLYGGTTQANPIPVK